MNRFTACLLLIVCWLGTQAQTVDSINAKAEKPFVFHHFSGINITYAANQYVYGKDATGFGIGYFKDRKIGERTFVMAQFNLVVNRALYYGQYYQWNSVYATYKDVDTGYDLDIPVRFSVRVGKEDADYTLFPTLGFGFYLPMYYTSKRYVNGALTERYNGLALEDLPFFFSGNVGLELKVKIGRKQHIGIGYTYSLMGLLGEDFNDIPDYHSAYLKFGWSRPKHKAKHKKDKP